MELLVLLLAAVNMLLAAAVILGGRYLLRRLDEVEEQVHRLALRGQGQDEEPPRPDAGTVMGSTAWNE